MKRPEVELYELVIKAIKAQIEELENGEKYSRGDDEIISELKGELASVECNYRRLKA